MGDGGGGGGGGGGAGGRGRGRRRGGGGGGGVVGEEVAEEGAVFEGEGRTLGSVVVGEVSVMVR